MVSSLQINPKSPETTIFDAFQRARTVVGPQEAVIQAVPTPVTRPFHHEKTKRNMKEIQHFTTKLVNIINNIVNPSPDIVAWRLLDVQLQQAPVSRGER